MSEMVERVRRALADYWLRHGYDPSDPDDGAALAAITAYKAALSEAGYVIVPREPTAAMVRAGIDGGSVDNDVTRIRDHHVRGLWGDMIDKALES